MTDDINASNDMIASTTDNSGENETVTSFTQSLFSYDENGNREPLYTFTLQGLENWRAKFGKIDGAYPSVKFVSTLIRIPDMTRDERLEFVRETVGDDGIVELTDEYLTSRNGGVRIPDVTLRFSRNADGNPVYKDVHDDIIEMHKLDGVSLDIMMDNGFWLFQRIAGGFTGLLSYYDESRSKACRFEDYVESWTNADSNEEKDRLLEGLTGIFSIKWGSKRNLISQMPSSLYCASKLLYDPEPELHGHNGNNWWAVDTFLKYSTFAGNFTFIGDSTYAGRRDVMLAGMRGIELLIKDGKLKDKGQSTVSRSYFANLKKAMNVFGDSHDINVYMDVIGFEEFARFVSIVASSLR